jgi:hypothetical protein
VCIFLCNFIQQQQREVWYAPQATCYVLLRNIIFETATAPSLFIHSSVADNTINNSGRHCAHHNFNQEYSYLNCFTTNNYFFTECSTHKKELHFFIYTLHLLWLQIEEYVGQDTCAKHIGQQNLPRYQTSCIKGLIKAKAGCWVQGRRAQGHLESGLAWWMAKRLMPPW